MSYNTGLWPDEPVAREAQAKSAYQCRVYLRCDAGLHANAADVQRNRETGAWQSPPICFVATSSALGQGDVG